MCGNVPGLLLLLTLLLLILLELKVQSNPSWGLQLP